MMNCERGSTQPLRRYVHDKQHMLHAADERFRIPRSWRVFLFNGQDTPARRQRNGGVENIVGIVVLLGLDEPAGIDAVAFCRAFHLVFGEQIRISTRKRDPVKGPKRGLRPPPVRHAAPTDR